MLVSQDAPWGALRHYPLGVQGCIGKHLVEFAQILKKFYYRSYSRSGSRGRVQGVRTPPEMTCGFLIQLVFCKKKKLCGLLVLK